MKASIACITKIELLEEEMKNANEISVSEKKSIWHCKPIIVHAVVLWFYFCRYAVDENGEKISIKMIEQVP